MHNAYIGKGIKGMVKVHKLWLLVESYDTVVLGNSLKKLCRQFNKLEVTQEDCICN